MPEQDEGSQWKSSAGGEKAWKEATDRVAARNADAKRAGKQERDAMDRERADHRRAAALRLDARLD